MKHYLEALVNYALKKGLIEPGDEGFAFNRLLEVMGLDAAEDGAACAPAALPEILAADQAARACARQYISTKE